MPLRPTTSTVSLPREESEPAPVEDIIEAAPATHADVDDASEEPEKAQTEPARAKSRKGRRASVPRWDEILFGAGQSDT